MCGIAGYNASPAWVAKYMTEKKTFNVLEQCWLHNEHRGRDAAGYMRVDAEDSKPYIRKRPGSAGDMLRLTEHPLVSPSLVLGAHTRAATRGDAKDNINNHPVEYEQMLVTHNGTIHNDKMFKKIVPLAKQDQIGDVDSYAIPIALSVVKDPHDMDHILEVLPKLQGGMAIHAVWKNYPGVSLLARGTRSPLHVRWNAEEQFFAYASEEDALFALIDETGMDPNTDEWQHRKFDEYTALVVEYGVPVKWGSYKRSGWSPGGNKLAYFVKRVFQGDASQEVYAHDNKDAWDAAEVDTNLQSARKAGSTKLIFTAKGGYRPKKTKIALPLDRHAHTHAALSEADRIYEHRAKPLLYAKFGEVEVVVGQHDGKVKDVYNHKRFPNVLRRVVEQKVAPPYKADDPHGFEDWLIKSTTKVHAPIKSRTEPKFSRPSPVVTKLPHTNPMTAGVKVSGKKTTGSQTTQLSLPATEINILTAPSPRDTFDDDVWPDEPDVIKLDLSIGWNDLKDYVIHPTSPMGFVQDLPCPSHMGLPYSHHERPEECENALLASIGFASCIDDVTLWYEVDPSLEIVTRQQEINGQLVSCYDAEGYGCQFEPYMHRQVRIGLGNDLVDQVMEVMMGERCAHCEMKMFIRKLPVYMENWTGDVNYVT